MKCHEASSFASTAGASVPTPDRPRVRRRVARCPFAHGVTLAHIIGSPSAGDQVQSSSRDSSRSSSSRSRADAIRTGLSAFLSGSAASPVCSSPIKASDATGGGVIGVSGVSAQAQNVSPPPAPPPATKSPSASSSPPAPAPAALLLGNRDPGVTLFDNLDWDPGSLLMGQEEADETSLRTAMRNSMDIHKLMLTRQKVRPRR